jgi:GT2 family glycosyltransferase
MSKLTISIVNYNSGEFLSKCLESIEECRNEVDFEVFVVDNASFDGSFHAAQKKFPKFQFIENDQNLGFGKAHNIILKKIKSEFVLILNPDTELKSDVLKTLVEFMEGNPDVGAVSCKVVLDNGKLDWATHRGFPTPLAAFLYYGLGNDRLYHQTGKNLSEIHEVDAISGAFFLTRRSVLEKVGLFDENFFMYGEDLDLCFRIYENGYKIMYVPTVSIVHHKGISSGLKEHSQKITTADLETKKRSVDAFYQAMQIFYNKHYSKTHFFFMNWLVNLGINLKWKMAKRKLVV